VRLRLRPDRAGTVTYSVEAGLTGGVPVWICEVTARARQGRAVSLSIPDEEGIASDLLVTVIRDPEADWYVAPAELLVDGRVRPGVTIVDVRGREKFDACRIPGSLEIPMHLVKTKSFLRSTEVVLLDEGLGAERVERECRRLAGDGFRSIHVLKGGLDRWRRQGGAVTGWQARDGGLTGISAAEFMESRGNSEWLIVCAGGEGSELEYGLPPHVTIPLAAGLAGFASEIEERLRRLGGVREVVIVDRDGSFREALGAVLEGVRDAGVFYLEGGQAAWRDHLSELTRMRGSRTAAIRTQVQGVTAPRKPCGQCP
jgi:rhodanese-related sulfurtransferase